jgi:hypothetical protein
MTILILAAGPDDGWKGPFPKQLCPLAGKPLLLWILEAFGGGTVVTNKAEILEMDGLDCFVPEQTDTIFDTILSTRELWEGRVLVLSGDQFYRSDMRDDILGYDGPTPATFESHTLVFDEKDYKAIMPTLEDLAGRKHGDFFNRLRITAGIPNVAETRADLDFDIWPYYEKFLQENEWAR